MNSRLALPRNPNRNHMGVNVSSDPPNQGKMDLLTINCIWNSRNALRNTVEAKSNWWGRAGSPAEVEFVVGEEPAARDRNLFFDFDTAPILHLSRLSATF
jgi:hypothetical protein